MYLNSAPLDWTYPLDAIYGAVGKPALWGNALDAICEVLQADTALLFTPCKQLLDLPHHYSKRYKIGTIQDYLENFVLEDPYNSSAASNDLFKMGNIIIGDELIHHSHLQNTRFFKEFCLKHQQGHLLASIPFGEDNAYQLPTTVLAFYKPAHDESFTQNNVEVLRKLLPHVQRAWLLHQQALQYQTLNHTLEVALNQLNHGVLVLNADGKMTFANALAKRLISSFYLAEIKSTKQSLGLPIKVLEISQLAKTQQIVCRKVTLNNQVLTIVASPLKSLPQWQSQFIANQAELGVMVWIFNDYQQSNTSVGLMTHLFNLTLAETKVLELLLSSHTPRQIAESLDVKITTVRTHLAALLFKTETERQQDLIRLAAVFTTIDTFLDG
ncbi:MAG: helix-turn-helix transcriptional regulator [Methylotenera sp.]|nr:helix-turn-helix transcriptional regulator [Methylotenera sp.]